MWWNFVWNTPYAFFVLADPSLLPEILKSHFKMTIADKNLVGISLISVLNPSVG